jgi:hypothetical protein
MPLKSIEQLKKECEQLAEDLETFAGVHGNESAFEASVMVKQAKQTLKPAIRNAHNAQ